MIVIVDYGIGNLRSIATKVKSLGYEVIVSSQISEIEKSSKLIFPGVGFFSEGMKNLNSSGVRDVLNKKVLHDKTPILGICLGMQLFTKRSDEGNVEGLGWVDAETLKFSFEDNKLRIPHVGWNVIKKKNESVIFKDIENDTRFYFTHSYYVKCNDNSNIATQTDYGIDFDSSIRKGNIYGTQFHPEKSHQHGLKIIDNFLRYA